MTDTLHIPRPAEASRQSIATDERFCAAASSYRAADRETQLRKAWKTLCQTVDGIIEERLKEENHD